MGYRLWDCGFDLPDIGFGIVRMDFFGVISQGAAN
jgi:hypothetical protein